MHIISDGRTSQTDQIEKTENILWGSNFGWGSNLNPKIFFNYQFLLPWKTRHPWPIFVQNRVELKDWLPATAEVFSYDISKFFAVVEKYELIGDHMQNLINFCPLGGFYSLSKLTHLHLSLCCQLWWLLEPIRLI